MEWVSIGAKRQCGRSLLAPPLHEVLGRDEAEVAAPQLAECRNRVRSRRSLLRLRLLRRLVMVRRRQHCVSVAVGMVVREEDGGAAVVRGRHLGFGRTVGSETTVPNMLVNLG
jgi:hypothetical protein